MRSGTAYVVFGKADVGAVALIDILSGERGGFAFDVSSFGLASADFNADGANDLVFGSELFPSADRSGRVFVMLGQP